VPREGAGLLHAYAEHCGLIAMGGYGLLSDTQR